MEDCHTHSVTKDLESSVNPTLSALVKDWSMLVSLAITMCPLDHSCNKYCDLIGQVEVSISHRYL